MNEKKFALNAKETILIVDDSLHHRTLITNLLEHHKFNVVEAADAAETLELIQSNQNIKLIIADYELQNMNALELIKSVRKKFKMNELPIVVISSQNTKATVVNCLKNGANDYLHKPFSHEEFYSRIYLTLSHKENLDLIAEKKETYETLFYKSSNAILLLENGIFTDCNDAAVALNKLKSKNDIIGKSPYDFSPKLQPDGEESVVKREKFVFQNITKFEWQYFRADGIPIWVDVLRTPLIINGREVTHIVLNDITATKKLEFELEALNKSLESRVAREIQKNLDQTSHMLQQSRLALMGEMISMIAHQWRQPLASIAAISSTLTLDVIMDEYNSEFFREKLESINELSQHLSSTIDDFRCFFKDNKEPQEVTLKEIVEGSLHVIGSSLKTKSIAVEVQFVNDLKFFTYANELKQVVLNILKNAEDALLEKNPSTMKITITGYTENTYACLNIEDNAGGVNAEHIDKIFDPYFSTKKNKDGTGLGLYMSKTIIHEHCVGKLEIANTKDGAVFTIKLPLKMKDK
ncbi:response regulator [bacterium]|nr:response regulator [bacterium]MBU1993947.1 response regulator [bacterium]